MDLKAERSFQTPLMNSTLLPMLLLSLARQKHTPDITKIVHREYDYVIVGAGSAGSVVASRLSEIPCVTVLLLEAGKSPPLLTEVPGLSRYFVFSDIDWRYKTAPQRYTGALLRNRQVVWPSGKAVGGSSTLNGMLYARGNPKNFDNWADEGAEGWSYKDVLPYLKKLEDNRDPEYVDDGYHGVGGPQTVHRPRYNPEIREPIFEAAKLLGYKLIDPNAERQTGFYDLQATMRAGQRCSTGKAYLVPAENRTNLDILSNAMVRKVVIKNRRAIGIQFDFGGTTYEVKARREVILSAGAVKTPQLLMLSGIGPRKELERFKIPMVADLPVGKNLQDHCASNVNFELDQSIPSYIAKVVSPVSITQYIENRTGPLGSSSSSSAMAFLKNGALRPNKDFPDHSLVFNEAVSDIGVQIGLSPDAYAQIYGPYEGRPFYTCFAYLLQPRSRGTVTLNSTDPYDTPIIDPNYFEDPKDIDDIVEGLKTCNRIGNSAPLQKVGSKPFRTIIPGCERYVGDEDMYLWCQVKSLIFTVSHPVGTARMGHPKDPRTVVDPYLRVKKIKGLRVIDASIMPIITSGDTNTPTIMVAEKASDIIKATVNCPTTTGFEDELLGREDSTQSENKHHAAYPDLRLEGVLSAGDEPWKSTYESKLQDGNQAPGGSIFKKKRNKKVDLKIVPWNREIPSITPWNKEFILPLISTHEMNAANKSILLETQTPLTKKQIKKSELDANLEPPHNLHLIQSEKAITHFKPDLEEPENQQELVKTDIQAHHGNVHNHQPEQVNFHNVPQPLSQMSLEVPKSQHSGQEAGHQTPIDDDIQQIQDKIKNIEIQIKKKQPFQSPLQDNLMDQILQVAKDIVKFLPSNATFEENNGRPKSQSHALNEKPPTHSKETNIKQKSQKPFGHAQISHENLKYLPQLEKPVNRPHQTQIIFSPQEDSLRPDTEMTNNLQKPENSVSHSQPQYENQPGHQHQSIQQQNNLKPQSGVSQQIPGELKNVQFQIEKTKSFPPPAINNLKSQILQVAKEIMQFLPFNITPEGNKGGQRIQPLTQNVKPLKPTQQHSDEPNVQQHHQTSFSDSQTQFKNTRNLPGKPVKNEQQQAVFSHQNEFQRLKTTKEMVHNPPETEKHLANLQPQLENLHTHPQLLDTPKQQQKKTSLQDFNQQISEKVKNIQMQIKNAKPYQSSHRDNIKNQILEVTKQIMKISSKPPAEGNKRRPHNKPQIQNGRPFNQELKYENNLQNSQSVSFSHSQAQLEMPRNQRNKGKPPNHPQSQIRNLNNHPEPENLHNHPQSQIERQTRRPQQETGSRPEDDKKQEILGMINDIINKQVQKTRPSQSALSNDVRSKILQVAKQIVNSSPVNTPPSSPNVTLRSSLNPVISPMQRYEQQQERNLCFSLHRSRKCDGSETCQKKSEFHSLIYRMLCL